MKNVLMCPHWIQILYPSLDGHAMFWHNVIKKKRLLYIKGNLHNDCYLLIENILFVDSLNHYLHSVIQLFDSSIGCNNIMLFSGNQHKNVSLHYYVENFQININMINHKL